MKFQFKLWILICLDVYLNILGLVHGIHIRRSGNFIDTSKIPRFGLIGLDLDLEKRTSYSLKNLLSNFIARGPVNLSFESNVLPRGAWGCLSSPFGKGISSKIISHLSFINNRIKIDFKSRTTRVYQENEQPRQQFESHMGKTVKSYEDKSTIAPVYKNEMDKLIDLVTEANRLYEKHKDWDKVYEEMGIEQKMKFTNDTLVCLGRSLLNRPAPPKDYFGKMMHELGFLMLYRNLKNMFKSLGEKLEEKLNPDKEEEFKRNKDYVFGIEPLHFGEKITPLTESFLRGFVHEQYFNHLEKMAKYNPKRAQKILTVIHRIFVPKKLSCDSKRDVNDYEILDDVETITEAEIDSYHKFIKEYPDLKWPSNDDDHLELYREWYNPKEKRILKLSSIIKEHYLDNYKPETNKTKEYVIKPLVSTLTGLSLGKASELVAEYLFSKNPEIFEVLKNHKNKFKYIIGGLTFLILKHSEEKSNYFYEVMKVLYGDVKTLEEEGAGSLMKKISESLKYNSMGLLKGLFDKEVDKNGESEVLIYPGQESRQYEEEIIKGIITTRKDTMLKLAEKNDLNQHQFKYNMENTALLLVFKSFIRLLSIFPYNSMHEIEENKEVVKGKKKKLKEVETVSAYKHHNEVEMVEEDKGETDKEEKVSRIKELDRVVRNLRYVNSICLPLSQTSAYRQMYLVACTLARISDLPVALGDEVLGYYISGEDIIENNETPDDDYSYLYEKGLEESGLPPENVPKNKFNALLLTSFFIQIYTNLDSFVTCTVPKNFGNEIDDDYYYLKEKGVSEEQLEMVRKRPRTRSTLDEIEDWALELNQNRGFMNREKIKYKYGIVPVDEFLGESKEEEAIKKKYELELMRENLEKYFTKKDRIAEIVSAMAMIFHVTEEFMLREMPKFWVNFVANAIYKELEVSGTDFKYYEGVFNMTPTARDEVRHRVMKIHLDVIKKKYPLRGNKRDRKYGQTFNSGTKEEEEELRERYMEIRRVCKKLDLDEEKVLQYFRLSTFEDLMNELRETDLRKVSKKDLELMKKKYESTDVVLVNALCEVVKERVNAWKKSLLEATDLEDYYLVEKHVQNLVDARRAVMKSMSQVVDKSHLSRISRAFQHNKKYRVKEFTDNEILGTDYIYDTEEELNGKGMESGLNKEGKGVKRLDKLKEFNGDWEVVDVDDGLTPMQRMRLEEKKQDEKDLTPLPLYGVDTDTDIRSRFQIDLMIEKGIYPKEFRCIPNEFHIGHRPIDPEYDIYVKMPEDPDRDKKPVILTDKIYKAWVIYSYRKRKPSLEEQENFVEIFPGCRKLVEQGFKDWKYLYVRLSIRNDDINSVRDWNKELLGLEGPIKSGEEEDFKKVLDYCYEEELLRVTKGAMEEVEDDIGNTTDFQFTAFEPSTNKRIDNIYSQTLPNEEQMEYLKKLQKFLNISQKSLESINSKCLWYALSKYFKGILDTNENQSLNKLVNQYFKPMAQKLNISQESYSNVLTKSVYGYLTTKFTQIFNQIPAGAAQIRGVDRFLAICKNLEIGLEANSKFTPSLDTKKMTVGLIERYVRSCLELQDKVDLDKLNYLFKAVGITGENKREILNEMGHKLYFKYIQDHHKDNAQMEVFDEIAHLHPIYGFEEKDLRKLLYDYRMVKALELYNGDIGLAGFKKALNVIQEDDYNKYCPLDKDMKINWFIQIMRDSLEDPKFQFSDFLQFTEPNYLSNISDPLDLQEKSKLATDVQDESGSLPDSREFSDSRTKGSELLEFLKLVIDKLGLHNNEFMEACFLYVEEHSPKLLKRVKQVDFTLENPPKQGVAYSEFEKIQDTTLYPSLVDFFKVLSFTPKNMIGAIRENLDFEDTSKIRKVLIESSHSLYEQRKTLKLVDLFLEK